MSDPCHIGQLIFRNDRASGLSLLGDYPIRYRSFSTPWRHNSLAPESQISIKTPLRNNSSQLFFYYKTTSLPSSKYNSLQWVSLMSLPMLVSPVSYSISACYPLPSTRSSTPPIDSSQPPQLHTADSCHRIKLTLFSAQQLVDHPFICRWVRLDFPSSISPSIVVLALRGMCCCLQRTELPPRNLLLLMMSNIGPCY